MGDQEFQESIETQLKNKAEAVKVAQFRPLLPVDSKAARFPGFRQRVATLKAGHQVEKGALLLPVDIVMHESVCMSLKDGTQLYADIFLPSRFQDHLGDAVGKIPALIAWYSHPPDHDLTERSHIDTFHRSPYGKQKGSTLLDDFPFRAGVPKHWLSGLQKWEGPDPAFWCAHDYAVVNVDARGVYTSEGDLFMFGYQEAEDGAEFVTWVSQQPWCNGKVGLTGNSWLAIAQWTIGSLRPQGLAALAPWEGLHDFYRHSVCAGGIPFVGFHESVARNGQQEDPIGYLKTHDLIDHYWDDKIGHPERINVPIYVVGSWTNPVHTPGAFEAWSRLPDNIPKWLRVHNSMEWPDYYDENSRRDLKRFFDHYLHGMTDNGWQMTPTVRVSVHNMGLGDQGDVVNRPESEFPLARTRYRKHYLHSDGKLGDAAVMAGIVEYDSDGIGVTFEFTMPTACETTGYFMAHLVMSSPSHTDMDVFVQVERLSSLKQRQGTLCIKPQSAIARALLKFMHDWQIGLGTAGMALHWGPSGQLRASHALDKEDTRSSPWKPHYLHTERQLLKQGEKRALDIPLRPYGLFWEKNDILKLTVRGRMVIPFAVAGLKMHETDNHGVHVIHCGDRGPDSSYLLVPYV